MPYNKNLKTLFENNGTIDFIENIAIENIAAGVSTLVVNSLVFLLVQHFSKFNK